MRNNSRVDTDALYKRLPLLHRLPHFRQITAFNRVGGVLIGRQAVSVKAGLDGYSLRLELVPQNRFILILADDAGHEKRLGPYFPDVIYRALLFASDGRPLVVTIVNTGLDGVPSSASQPRSTPQVCRADQRP